MNETAQAAENIDELRQAARDLITRLPDDAVRLLLAEILSDRLK